ncbi:MAG: hypothetical protein BGO67_11475 [Alphaproteobacteria bacterium 41-28]|nr:MAG: hypothetical protein BGO67_11475 [Alphaproteobacteria bacterium 41-28]
MSKDKSSFEDLEKQLAVDTLEKALKELHQEINGEIENNKKAFSEEISKTLTSFKQNLEQKVVQEIDQKISSLFTKHFADTSVEVKSSFEHMFDPVLKRTEEDMRQLKTQGDHTLQSWKNMMNQYTGFWTKPFFLMLFVCILTGLLISLSSSYYLSRESMRSKQLCESNLQWFAQSYSDLKNAQDQKVSAETQLKKKKK